MKQLKVLFAASALFAAAFPTWAALAEPLLVRVSAPSPVVRGDVDVLVDVSVTNPTRAAVSVLRWDLPTNARDQSHFVITRDGQPVAYTGRLMKRAAPTAADYVRIEAGATLNYSVELTAGYDLSQNGTYAIRYVGDVASAGADAQRAAPLYLWLEARSGRFPRSAAVNEKAAVVPGTDAISFTGACSTTQQTQLTTAVAEALTYANNAVSYFNTSKFATQRFVKWFGPGTKSSFAIAKRNFTAIQSAFATQPLALDCSCTDAGVYAYVFANAPYKIYACPVFWSAPMTGTDSKAGTLIHEMSHFTVVAGTQDFAYGQTNAGNLAISNPANALRNADNHEYFAENTPVLP